MASPPDHRAPEGAHCGMHPERAAYFTCPRCGSYACVSCWLVPLERCQSCVQRDPASAAPPIAWEQHGKTLAQRYFGTFRSAFSPFKSAPAFVHGEVAAARRFMLLSALPLALLSGVIPHTRTLMFAGNLAVHVIGQPSELQIAWDVARAMLVGLTLNAAQFLCLLLPFTSLVRAYAPTRYDAAQRALYYRIWLLPAALLLACVAAGVLPPLPDPATLAPDAVQPAAELAIGVVRLLCFALVVLLIMTMSATARLACGLSPMMATVIVLVSLVVMLFGAFFAELGVLRMLPGLPPPAT